MDDKALEEFLALRCNYPGKDGKVCGRVLEEGWATSCSHVFCPEHAQEWFQRDERCPVCLDKQGNVRMAKVAMATNEQAKAQQLLVGRGPPDIMLAASTAMKFWIEQKLMEFEREKASERALNDQVKRLIGNGRMRLTEAETMTKSLQAGAEELQRQLRETEGQLSRNREEAARLQARIRQVQQAYKETLGRAAGLTSMSTPRIPRKCTLQSLPRAQDDIDFHLQRPGLHTHSSRSPRRESRDDGQLSAGHHWPR
mmetsp:Transcript_101745/g.303646  ORF Transcript_101745/g.303646 Transcript_101745/m.303646 type:complete len:255 (-) Transcript_101745:118-882(-)